MNPICVMLPSRGRPEKLKECLDSFLQTGTGLADIFVLLDSDDPALPGYGYLGGIGGNVTLMIGPPARVGPKLNWFWGLMPWYESYLLMGDDVRSETTGWDEKLLTALREKLGGWGLTYGTDYWGEMHANHPLISGNILKAIGYYALEGLEHAYLDTVLFSLCKTLGKTFYCPEVSFPHLHHVKGLSVRDETYIRAEETLKPGQDISTKWHKRGGLDRDLAKVREAMGAECK